MGKYLVIVTVIIVVAFGIYSIVKHDTYVACGVEAKRLAQSQVKPQDGELIELGKYKKDDYDWFFDKCVKEHGY